ncbi:MAG TPA: HEAT repeat domain-containing protein, partial [Nannocystaceae bacterium]|nr:HEAT repeat domain-containing protein [Nannocystaceae bacterium]
RYGRHLAEADAPLLRAIGLAAFALHRREPPALLAALHDPAPEPRRRALKAVGELARRDLLPILREHLTDPDPHARHHAAFSAALLGDPRGAEHLFALALDPPEPRLADPAIRLAARRLPLSAIAPWAIHSLGQNTPHSRLAIAALADAGDPAQIAHLLHALTSPPLARLAAAAITQITGIDLGEYGLEGPPPSEDVSTFSRDDPDDDQLDLDPDDDLPWPDPEALATKWWPAYLETCPSGQPLLLGRPRTIPALTNVLRTAAQPHRLAAAHHLLALQPGSPLFDHRAPAHRQFQTLTT